MTGIYLQLTKTYLRRIWLPWLIILGMFIGGPLAMLGLFWLKGTPLPPEAYGDFDGYGPYLSISLLVFSILTLVAQWQIFPHLYPRPISTPALAGWLMLTGVATSVVANLIILGAYRLLFDARWPVVAPTLFLASLILVGQSLHWNLLKGVFLRVVIGFAVLGGVVYWLASRFQPNGFKKPMVPWYYPNWEEGLTMLAAVTVAIVLGIRGLAQHRQGESRSSREADDMSLFISRRTPKLTEASQALSWFLWQRSRVFTLGLATAVGLFMLLPFVFGDDAGPKDAAIQTILGVTAFLPALACFGLGVALGLDVKHSVRHDLMPILSTRPVTTELLAKHLLWNAFKCTLILWGLLTLIITLLATGCFLQVSPADLMQQWRDMEGGMLMAPLVLITSFVASWTALTWMAMLGWTGREKMLMIGAGVITAVPVLSILLVNFIVPHDLQQVVATLLVWQIGVMILLTTVGCTLWALSRELLSEGMLALMVAGGLVIPFVFGLIPAGELDDRVLFCIYATAALLPFPATPLVLAWNRNR